MSHYTDMYAQLKRRIEQLGASTNVTHYILSLGAQDAETGQYAKSFAAGATIQMLIISRAARHIVTSMGVIMHCDALGFTKDTVNEGDEIKDSSSTYYVIDSVKSHYVGDKLIVYECQLIHMPLHE